MIKYSWNIEHTVMLMGTRTHKMEICELNKVSEDQEVWETHGELLNMTSG